MIALNRNDERILKDIVVKNREEHKTAMSECLKEAGINIGVILNYGEILIEFFGEDKKIKDIGLGGDMFSSVSLPIVLSGYFAPTLYSDKEIKTGTIVSPSLTLSKEWANKKTVFKKEKVLLNNVAWITPYQGLYVSDLEILKKLNPHYENDFLLWFRIEGNSFFKLY